MCEFFSVVSDGKGKVLYFTPEEVVQILSSGNKENYAINSHTSLMKFKGISAKEEEYWNKWEYDPDNDTLKEDAVQKVNDKDAVFKSMREFFNSKDKTYLRNLYGMNSGNRNSGDWNSGDGNSGNRNSGDWNSGNWNSGDGNSGDWNSGDWNSGNRNSGNWNSGDWNSGDWNSGDGNSGSGVLNSFCTKRLCVLFNKPCTKEEYEKLSELSWSWFVLTDWVYSDKMSDEEKKNNPGWDTRDGYLKKFTYKEAWSKCPTEEIEKIKKLKNFSTKLFEEISGLKVSGRKK